MSSASSRRHGPLHIAWPHELDKLRPKQRTRSELWPLLARQRWRRVQCVVCGVHVHEQRVGPRAQTVMHCSHCNRTVRHGIIRNLLKWKSRADCVADIQTDDPVKKQKPTRSLKLILDILWITLTSLVSFCSSKLAAFCSTICWLS